MDSLDMASDTAIRSTDDDSDSEPAVVVKSHRSSRERRRTTSTSSTDSSTSATTDTDDRPAFRAAVTPPTTSAPLADDGDDGDDDEDGDGLNNNSSDPFRSPELPYFPPFLMPFQERRRLSQCKEEEDEDDAGSSPADVANSRAARAAQHITGTRHKFIVTRTPETASAAAGTAAPSAATTTAAIPRVEAAPLRNMTARQNAATIHFPCRSAVAALQQQRSSVMREAFFSPQKAFSPHMDKRFFDTSLVEIRDGTGTGTGGVEATTEERSSTQSLNMSAGDVVDGNVWVPRSSSGTQVASVSAQTHTHATNDFGVWGVFDLYLHAKQSGVLRHVVEGEGVV